MKRGVFWRFWLVFCFFLLFCTPQFSSSNAETLEVQKEVIQRLYSNNEKALKRLTSSEKKLAELESLTAEQSKTLNEQAELLEQAKKTTQELEQSLRKTNDYLATFSKEQKAKINRAKRQRNVMTLLAGVLVFKSLK